MLKNSRIKNLYDESMESQYHNDYEFNRWFLTPRLRQDFYMTYNSISFHLKNIDFTSCLEFGPGPGTWTRVLYKKQPNAHYDLVDISSSMKEQFELEMRGGENVHFILEDITEFNLGKKYDFFFSSRAIEYLEDKEKFFSHISSLMNVKGRGMIITKNPDYGFLKKGKSRRFQHTGQISKKEMLQLLVDRGFENIKFSPVIVRLPLVDRIFLFLSEKIYEKIFYKNMEGTILSKITESYIVTFQKK